MIGFKTASTLLATVTVLSLAPIGSAYAALISAKPPACSPGDITTNNLTNAIACSGSWKGNDANQQDDIKAQLLADFGVTTGLGDWVFGGKSDDIDESGVVTNGPFTSNPYEATQGLLTFDTLQTGFFAVSLKASESFSLYLLNGGTAGIGSFNFDTIGTATNVNRKAQGLSHASLWTFTGTTPPPPTPIPTPALLPGLIGMGVAALRKRKGEAEESAEA